MYRSNRDQVGKLSAIWMKARGWIRNDDGSVLPILALGMTAMLGFMGLALDFGYLYQHKRTMQTAADAGAMAGASELFRSKTSLIAGSSQGGTLSNGFTNGANGVNVVVNNPPTSGYYQGNNQYVEVEVSQNAPSFFIQIFGRYSTLVRARAVAGAGARSANCIYALDPSEEKALTVTSQSKLTANCGIVDDSNAYNALNIESGSTVSATTISVTGGSNVTSGSGVTPTPVTQSPPEPDPLGYLQPPPSSGCTYNGRYKVSSGTVSLNPGIYCGGIEIASGSTVTFNPGLYIVKADNNDGGLLVASGSSVKGTGVTFFNIGGQKYKPIEIMSGSSADLAAPTSGPWKDILFYQDRNSGKPDDHNRIQSNIVAKFTGIMYFPTQYLDLATSNSTVTVTGAIVARMIMIESGSNVIVKGDGSGVPGNSPLKRLSLVE